MYPARKIYVPCGPCGPCGKKQSISLVLELINNLLSKIEDKYMVPLGPWGIH